MTYYLDLDRINSYQISYRLSNHVWGIVVNWNFFSKDTIGKQFVRAVDSISANIAEGFGRYGKRDKINFYRYSYGSIKESCDWSEKAKERNLLTEKEYKYIIEQLNKLPREINSLIKFTNDRLSI